MRGDVLQLHCYCIFVLLEIIKEHSLYVGF